MDILDDMGVSKSSAKVFSKVNYSFKSNSELKGIGSPQNVSRCRHSDYFNNVFNNFSGKFQLQ